MNRLFAIADTHLSLSADKPMDVFGGWTDYVKRLEDNWRAVVDDGDVVVVAGDISWAMRLEDTYADFQFLNNLPGKKLFIKGNHDYWWSTMNKLKSFASEKKFDTIDFIFNNCFVIGDYGVCGTRGWFDEPADEKIINREVGRLQSSIDDCVKQGKEPIVFLHYPPIFDGSIQEQIYSCLVKNHIRRCFFGHIHGDKTGRYDCLMSDGIEFNLISCDHLEFSPRLVQKF